jgi:hypothetical protein
MLMARSRYQCNGTAHPCKLRWYPGKLCFKIMDVPFGAGVPGYLARARALGYRTVSLKRLLDESPWLQFTSECQRC